MALMPVTDLHLLVSGTQVGATERGHAGQHIQVCESAAM